MSIMETITRQIEINRRGHFKDCTLITPDVCSCDVRYGEMDDEVENKLKKDEAKK